MKIGFFTDSYLPQLDGVATSVDACVKELEKQGHEIYIVAPKHPKYKDTRKNVFRLRSVKFSKEMNVRIGLQLPSQSLLQLSRIDFDIIHGHSGGPITFLGWQLARLKNIPFVCTYHTLWSRYVHYFFNGKVINPKVMEVSSRLFGNVCDCLIAPTYRVKKELVSYGIKRPVHVIPSGIAVETFEHVEKGFIRKKAGIPADKKILLYVGRLGQEKSVEFLIKSFALIYKKQKDVVFVLVGTGAEKKSLQQLAEKLNIDKHVYFFGGVDHAEIAKVYADAYLFLFASKTETQGMVILESFASGLPVVVVKDPAYEGIVEDGMNGYQTRRNSKEYAKTVVNLLSDKATYQQFAKQAKKTAQKFSTSMMVQALEEVYEEMVIEHRMNLKWWRKRVRNIANLLSM